MKMQDTHTNAVHNQFASAVIMANGTPFTVPNALYNALMLAADLEGEREALTGLVESLERQIDRDAEKVTFYDEVAEAEHLFDIDEAAKIVGTGRTRLLKYLRKHRVLMSSTHRFNRPYQKHLDAGQFEVKHLQYMNRNTGELKLKSMPFLTGKGLIWLQQFIAKHGRTGL